MNQTDFLKQYGPWAIITGASDGIGRAFAYELASRGFHLILVARRKDVLSDISNELSKKYGVQIKVIDLDFGKPDANTSLLAETSKLDVGLLIAAAGFGTSGAFLHSDITSELNLLHVNCRSVLEQCYGFGKKFQNKGRGGMILMSSLLAFQGTPWSANYSASKAYIQNLAEGLHEELRLHGVDVIACAPGPVNSGFANRARMNMTMTASPATIAQETLKKLGKCSLVRPGFLSKFLEWSLKPLPRRGRVRMIGRIMRRMTTSHQSI